MTNKNEMYSFFRKIINKKLMTKFLINIFDYEGLEDYNYISRLSSNKDSVILDIYDNVTENRFNRYCFNFNEESKTIFNEEYDNVFLTNIAVLNSTDDDNKLIKFAYLFNLSKKDRVEYGSTFLDKKFVDLL